MKQVKQNPIINLWDTNRWLTVSNHNSCHTKQTEENQFARDSDKEINLFNVNINLVMHVLFLYIFIYSPCKRT